MRAAAAEAAQRTGSQPRYGDRPEPRAEGPHPEGRRRKSSSSVSHRITEICDTWLIT